MKKPLYFSGDRNYIPRDKAAGIIEEALQSPFNVAVFWRQWNEEPGDIGSIVYLHDKPLYPGQQAWKGSTVSDHKAND